MEPMKPIVRRRGKIGLLSKELREEINRMIQGRATHQAILSLLAERGHNDIDEGNLTSWIQGDKKGSSGYKDWLQTQELLAAMEVRREFAQEIASRGDGFALQEAARLLAATQLTD